MVAGMAEQSNGGRRVLKLTLGTFATFKNANGKVGAVPGAPFHVKPHDFSDCHR